MKAVLEDELAPTDLQTWQVPGRPAHRVDRARLRARWREDRFVQPPPVDPQLHAPGCGATTEDDGPFLAPSQSLRRWRITLMGTGEITQGVTLRPASHSWSTTGRGRLLRTMKSTTLAVISLERFE
jgi:hypothetical protein